MNEKAIRDRLVEQGEILFKAPKQFISFTKIREADELLNDLTGHPHAFVLACVMDRQMKAEKAWVIPYKIFIKLALLGLLYNKTGVNTCKIFINAL